MNQEYKKPTKRKSRSTRDKSRYWNSRYKAVLNAGFTSVDAEWAANNGIPLKSKQLKDLLASRRGRIAWLMKRKGCTRAEAIVIANEDFEARLQLHGVKERIIFMDISP